MRCGWVVEIKADMIERYKLLHSNAWTQINHQIKECNIHDYSIFLTPCLNGKHYLFGNYTYAGHDLKQDLAKMSEDPCTQEWWKLTGPCQVGEWQPLEEVYYLQ